MASTIILYDQLENAETGGTWVQISIPSGATGPAAPGTYNGSIDFTGEPTGAYIYEYTVGVATARVTVNWTVTPDRNYTSCADAYYINSGQQPPFTYVVEDDSREICGSASISTDQETPIPSKWAYGPYSGDLWYFFIAQAKNTSYTINFTVDGTQYGSESIGGPAIEVFTHGLSENCANKVQAAHAASYPGQSIVTTNITIPATVGKVVSFRVTSPQGEEGKFDINIEGICP